MTLCVMKCGRGGLRQIQRREERLLLCRDLSQAAELLPVGGLYRLLVNAPELFEQPGRQLGGFKLEARRRQ